MGEPHGIVVVWRTGQFSHYCETPNEAACVGSSRGWKSRKSQ
jgi:hypothetical protein